MVASTLRAVPSEVFRIPQMDWFPPMQAYRLLHDRLSVQHTITIFAPISLDLSQYRVQE